MVITGFWLVSFYNHNSTIYLTEHPVYIYIFFSSKSSYSDWRKMSLSHRKRWMTFFIISCFFLILFITWNTILIPVIVLRVLETNVIHQREPQGSLGRIWPSCLGSLTLSSRQKRNRSPDEICQTNVLASQRGCEKGAQLPQRKRLERIQQKIRVKQPNENPVLGSRNDSPL